MPRARNPLGADNTTSTMNSNAVLLHDERRVKGCKDFVGEDFAGAAMISSTEFTPGKDSCRIVILVLIRVESGVTAPNVKNPTLTDLDCSNPYQRQT